MVVHGFVSFYTVTVLWENEVLKKKVLISFVPQHVELLWSYADCSNVLPYLLLLFWVSSTSNRLLQSNQPLWKRLWDLFAWMLPWGYIHSYHRERGQVSILYFHISRWFYSNNEKEGLLNFLFSRMSHSLKWEGSNIMVE